MKTIQNYSYVKAAAAAAVAAAKKKPMDMMTMDEVTTRKPKVACRN